MQSPHTRIALADALLKIAENLLIDPTHGTPSISNFVYSEAIAKLRTDFGVSHTTVARVLPSIDAPKTPETIEVVLRI